jgi:hypothetical protein
MRRWTAAAGLALVALVGCGDDGGGDETEDFDQPEASEDGDDGGEEASFGEPIEVDDLTVTVGEPYRYDFSPEVVRVDVTFETDGDEVSTPNPTLECEGEEFEIDHDAANYASEVSSDEPEDGEWAWSAGEDCAEGSLDLGDATLEFSEVADRE